MPPYYIGKGMITRINRGYHGTPKDKRFEELWHSEFESYPELFDRFIIETYNTHEEALSDEETLIKMLDAPKSPLFLNKSYGGTFGNCVIRHTLESKRKIGKASSDRPRTLESRMKSSASQKGKLKSEISKERMRGRRGPMEPRSEEEVASRKLISETKKSQWDRLETVAPDVFLELRKTHTNRHYVPADIMEEYGIG